MTDVSRVFATLKPFGGVVVPLGLLSFALVRADGELLVGAMLAFGGVFGVVGAYARYVDFDTGARASDEAERTETDAREHRTE